jgi:hypothetical protein
MHYAFVQDVRLLPPGSLTRRFIPVPLNEAAPSHVRPFRCTLKLEHNFVMFPWHSPLATPCAFRPSLGRARWSGRRRLALSHGSGPPSCSHSLTLSYCPPWAFRPRRGRARCLFLQRAARARRAPAKGRRGALPPRTPVSRAKPAAAAIQRKNCPRSPTANSACKPNPQAAGPRAPASLQAFAHLLAPSCSAPPAASPQAACWGRANGAPRKNQTTIIVKLINTNSIQIPPYPKTERGPHRSAVPRSHTCLACKSSVDFPQESTHLKGRFWRVLRLESLGGISEHLRPQNHVNMQKSLASY